MMQLYTSHKTVQASPMTRFDAQELELVRDKSPNNEDGFHIIYEDGYESWSPKEVFLNGYTPKQVEETWLDQLKIEHRAISERLEKLINYLETVPVEDQYQREMLVVQSTIMESYRTVIEARVLVADKEGMLSKGESSNA